MYAFSSSDRVGNHPLRQVVRCPMDSDGVGQALRQGFPSLGSLPMDMAKLLARLNR